MISPKTKVLTEAKSFASRILQKVALSDPRKDKVNPGNRDSQIANSNPDFTKEISYEMRSSIKKRFA